MDMDSSRNGTFVNVHQKLWLDMILEKICLKKNLQRKDTQDFDNFCLMK